MIAFFLSIVIISGLIIFWSIFIEARSYKVNHRTVNIDKKLSKPLQVLHITDVHFSEKSAKRLGAFFDHLSHIKCDYVFCTGDLIDDSTGIQPCLENMKKIKDSGKEIYAVYGNHDYYEYRKLDILIYNVLKKKFPVNHQRHDVLHQGLLDIGVHVMTNQSRELKWEENDLVFHGVDDPVTGHSDLRKLQISENHPHPNFLLTHSVDILKLMPEGSVDVSFSGHSHGGQVRFPWIGPIVTHTSLGKQFTMGIQEFRKTRCVISRGVGTSRYFPARFLCPPEAVLVEVQGIS